MNNQSSRPSPYHRQRHASPSLPEWRPWRRGSQHERWAASKVEAAVPTEALTVDAMAVKVAAARAVSPVLEAELRLGSWIRGTAAGPA